MEFKKEERLTKEVGESREKGKEKSKEKILRLMVENPAITIPEIAAILDLSIASVEKAIRILKQQKWLRRIGPDKGGYWETTIEQNEGQQRLQNKNVIKVTVQ